MELFSISETQLPDFDSGKHRSCTSCGLYKYVLSPKMKPFGEFNEGIMNLGEAPGETEDRRGKPWQGKIGQALQSAYSELGLDLFRDCININTINCRPTDDKGANRPPSPAEISACRSRVLRVIREYKPKVIVMLGFPSVISLIGGRWQKDLDNISKWRGWTIPDREYNTWLCPVFHPGYIEREDEHVGTIWMRDLKRAVQMRNVPFPEYGDELDKVKILPDSGEVCRVLFEFLEAKKPFALDYETTGLKPDQIDVHSIPCMSICNSPDISYSFEYRHLKEFGIEPFQRLMQSEDCPKIAFNIPHEYRWTRAVFNVEPVNWLFDPMIATHVLDNRPGICSLKFQAYVNLGVVDYDSEVEAYLKSKDKKNANSVNKIHKLTETTFGMQKLLKYCGLDSLFTYRIAMKQMSKMGIQWSE